MLNNSNYMWLKSLVFLFVFGMFLSCEEELYVTFTEINILEEKDAIVEINIPKAEGDNEIVNNINSVLENFTKTALSSDSITNSKDSFEEKIVQFNSSFLNFKNEMSDELKSELTPWEVSIEGEVIYQSNNLISISINKYLNTGGIHGSSKVSFLNFDSKTGNQLDYNDFITNKNELKKFLKSQFEKKVGSISLDDFKLPETIGISDEGVIILYNVNEIPSYIDKLTEFTVPFDEIERFLKVY